MFVVIQFIVPSIVLLYYCTVKFNEDFATITSMRFFGRKKEGESEERSEQIKPDTRKIKDLKPENKKNRKEPKKPWEKGERFLVFLVMAVTAGGSLLLALSSRGWKLPGYPQLQLPKFSFSKTYVFDEPMGKGEIPEVDSAPVVEEFRSLTNNLTGVYGFYVVRLTDGASYGYNHKNVFQAASLIKLPVMVMAYRGGVDLDDTYRLREEDKVAGSGPLQYEGSDTIWTYGELLGLMGEKSDNTAFNVVVNAMGAQSVEQFLRANAMSATSYEKNTTSPADIGGLFLKLWNGDFMDTSNRDVMLDHLIDTIYEEHLPKGIPDEVPVAHKYGREVNVVNDAGVIYTENPFVIVIMSEGVKMDEADAVFPKLAKLIYEFESK